jgi:hypothetical protein
MAFGAYYRDPEQHCRKQKADQDSMMETDDDGSIASFRNDFPAPADDSKPLAEGHAAVGRSLANLAPGDPAVYRVERRGVRPIKANDANSVATLDHRIGEPDDILLQSTG